jgi:uncharacterized lipoprotein YmbA
MFRKLTIAVVLALALAACKGSPATTAQPAPPAPAAAAATTTTTTPTLGWLEQVGEADSCTDLKGVYDQLDAAHAKASGKARTDLYGLMAAATLKMVDKGCP